MATAQRLYDWLAQMPAHVKVYVGSDGASLVCGEERIEVDPQEEEEE